MAFRGKGKRCFAISICAARLPGNQSFVISFSFYVLSAMADDPCAVAVLALASASRVEAGAKTVSVSIY
jgi:hypothetical protein